MPIPQVNDRIKEAPAVMLRAVFAGVGQLLLAADKVRARAAGTTWPYDRTAPKGGPAGSGIAERQSRTQSRWHTLDDGRSAAVPLSRERTYSYPPPQRPSPGSPGPATRAEPAGRPAAAEPIAQPKPAVATEPAKPSTAAGPAAQAAPAAAAEPSAPAAGAKPGADAPPLDGYDGMSLPSLRARLRGFDAATLRALLAYEKGHANRDDVITLFERRLEKITAE
jgi:hypothetical protein